VDDGLQRQEVVHELSAEQLTYGSKRRQGWGVSCSCGWVDYPTGNPYGHARAMSLAKAHFRAIVAEAEERGWKMRPGGATTIVVETVYDADGWRYPEIPSDTPSAIPGNVGGRL